MAPQTNTDENGHNRCFSESVASAALLLAVCYGKIESVLVCVGLWLTDLRSAVFICG
jgi:hypothetical protein